MALNSKTPNRLHLSAHIILPAQHRSRSSTGPLREADEFWISRQPIPSNALLLKPALHIDPPRLIKAHRRPDPAALHDLLDLALCVVVEAGAAVASRYIAGEVEGGGGEPGIYVTAKGGGDRRIEVAAERKRGGLERDISD
jgi:hypothetical protein